MTTTFSLLDQAELMQLALNASAINDSGTAIAYLKEAVSRPDANGLAHYILGAEYAQIKMYERAAGELEAALALDPALSIARLQLGLLWITGGAATQAAVVLAPLQELSGTSPLHHFGKGLCHLIREELIEAKACLEEGMSLNDSNPPLNADVQKIITELELLAASGKQFAQRDPDGAKEGGGDATHHIMLSAYTGNTSH